MKLVSAVLFLFLISSVYGYNEVDPCAYSSCDDGQCPGDCVCDVSENICITCEMGCLQGVQCEEGCLGSEHCSAFGPFCDEHEPGYADSDQDMCCYGACLNISCDSLDVIPTQGSIATLILESEVLHNTCNSDECLDGDSSACCFQEEAVCNEQSECDWTQDILTYADESTGFRCFHSNGEAGWFWSNSTPGPERNCGDNHDNDCDGLVDYDDDDCGCIVNSDCDYSDCSQGICSEGVCLKVNDSEPCLISEGICCDGECCEGECSNGECVAPSGCSEKESSCSSTSDCCDGLYCSNNHCCESIEIWDGSCKKKNGNYCNEDSECLNYCCNNYCQSNPCPGSGTGSSPTGCAGNPVSCGRGVCSGMNKTCENGTWVECTYTDIPGYEETEISCDDSLDNDCDGFTDSSDTDCGSETQLGCCNGNVWLIDSQETCIEEIQDCSPPCANDPCKSCTCQNGECLIFEPQCFDGDGCCPDECSVSRDMDCCALAECMDDDGCCPENCSFEQDNDCASCDEDADCDDWFDETIDSCELGTCRHQVKSIPVVYIEKPLEGEQIECISGTCVVPMFVVNDEYDTELECFYRINNQTWIQLSSTKRGVGQSIIHSFELPKNITPIFLEVQCANDQGTYSEIANRTFYLLAPSISTTPKEDFGGSERDPFESNPVIKKVIETKVIGIPLWELIGILAVFLFIVLLLLIAFVIYSKRSAKTATRRTLEEEKKQRSTKRYSKLKQDQKELGKKLEDIKQKEATLGLNTHEKAQKESYEEELVGIEEELLSNEKFISELDVRAEKALQEARKGVPSKEIRRRLFEEGYTPREVNKIKELFKKKKKQEKT